MVDLTNIWLYRLHMPNLMIIYNDNDLYVATKTVLVIKTVLSTKYIKYIYKMHCFDK